MAVPVNLTSQNWLITPAVNLPVIRSVPGATDVLPTTVSADQLWLLVLTGMGGVLFAGNNSTSWVSETLTIVPDVQAPLAFALNSPLAQPLGTKLGLNLVMWAPFAAISGVTANNTFSIDAGFALDVWRPTPFIPTLKDSNGNPVTQVFQGIDVDVSALSTSEIVKVSYNITLLGRIVHLGHPVNR